LQKELFNGTSSKRKEGHADTRSCLTVLAYQSTRDSGLPVSSTHPATGLKPLVDKDWAAVNRGGVARGAILAKFSGRPVASTVSRAAGCDLSHTSTDPAADAIAADRSHVGLANPIYHLIAAGDIGFALTCLPNARWPSVLASAARRLGRRSSRSKCRE
jgi:molybdate-binding protein